MLFLATLLLLAPLATAIFLPPLTGTSLVGTISLELVDKNRTDPLAPTVQPRDLMISVFYPVHNVDGNALAPAFDPAYASFLSSYVHIPPGIPESVISQAYKGAYLDTNYSTQCRILLFSPGYGFGREDYTATLSNLASQGFIVISVDHPYDTAFVGYPDGRFVLGIPNPLNETTAPLQVVGAEYLNIRVADLISVLDALGTNATFARQIPGMSEALNIREVGVFGHSLGGASAATAMSRDARFKCGGNPDGSFWGNVTRMAEKIEGRDFMVVAIEGHNVTSDSSWATFLSSDSPHGNSSIVVTVEGATHVAFTDFAYIYEVLRSEHVPGVPGEGGLFGTVSGQRILEIESGLLGTLFRKCLEGKSDVKKALKRLKGQFPEVSVQ